MPIYAYRCGSCGFQKDVLQKLSDAPLSDCPNCGAAEFSKQLSAPAFQLKGSGWYVTDFRDNGKPPGSDAGAGKEDGGGKAGDESGAKPAEKAGEKPAAKSADGASRGGEAAPSAASAPAPAPTAAPSSAPSPAGGGSPAST